MKKVSTKTIVPGGVNEYIAQCPKEVKAQLIDIRSAIKSVAPSSIETVSYFQIPGYSYPGYSYNGMFAWFSYKEPVVRLHVIPPAIALHKKELSAYATTSAIVSFPVDKKLPISLIKKLVKASIKIMKTKG